MGCMILYCMYVCMYVCIVCMYEDILDSGWIQPQPLVCTVCMYSMYSMYVLYVEGFEPRPGLVSHRVAGSRKKSVARFC